jgi:HEAT repeat protein
MLRTLGKIRDSESVDLLLSVLKHDPKEAKLGLEDPPNVFIYKAMTPFHRAAAAHALGEIGEPRAVPELLQIVTDFDNAISVRHAAAGSLGKLCNRESLVQLRELTADYPEIIVRRELLAACREVQSRVSSRRGPQSQRHTRISVVP